MNPPESTGDMFPDPEWMPENADSTKARTERDGEISSLYSEGHAI